MSLRTKQALILLIATVLPFAVGGAAVALVVAPAYRHAVAYASEAETRRLGEQVGWNLSRETSRLERLAAWKQIRQLAVRGLSGGDEALLLQNPVSRELSWWQETGETAVGVLATDARGRVIAASRKPPSTDLSAERWWRNCFAGGAGRVVLSDVAFDAEANVWTLLITVPIYRDGTPPSPAVGTLQLALDVNRAFQDVSRASVGGSGQALLLDRGARIVVAPNGADRGHRTLEELGLHRLKGSPVGTYVAHGDDDTDLFAWSEVPLGPRVGLGNALAPVLYVVTRRSAGEAFGPLRTLNRWMLGIAAFTIILAVALGYWLAEVLVVRHVRALVRGMRALARGQFDQAAAIADQLAGVDSRTPEATPVRETAGVP